MDILAPLISVLACTGMHFSNLLILLAAVAKGFLTGKTGFLEGLSEKERDGKDEAPHANSAERHGGRPNTPLARGLANVCCEHHA